MHSQKILLEQMKVSCALDMSSNACTYIHFQHTEYASDDGLIENPIGTDESKSYIVHEWQCVYIYTFSTYSVYQQQCTHRKPYWNR